MSTIREVAKTAGVSVGTVSHFLNGSANVLPRTRAKILRAMDDLNYYPDSRARRLAKQKTNIIATIFLPNPDRTLHDPIYLDFIAAIGNEVNRRGYDLLLYNPTTYRDQMAKIIQLSRGREVDGILLIGNTDPDPRVEYLRKLGFPFVLIGRAAGVDTVYLDNVGGAYQAVSYLIRLGHRKIGCISGTPEMMGGKDRLQGYLQAMAEGGLKVDDTWIREGGFTEEGGYRAAKELLQTEDFSAIFSVGDVMALGAIKAMNEGGYRIPDDVALVSFDDFVMASHVSPPLTTVRQDTSGLGRTAAGLLIEKIHKPKNHPVQIVLPVELIVRQSCGGTRRK